MRGEAWGSGAVEWCEERGRGAVANSRLAARGLEEVEVVAGGFVEEVDVEGLVWRGGIEAVAGGVEGSAAAARVAWWRAARSLPRRTAAGPRWRGRRLGRWGWRGAGDRGAPGRPRRELKVKLQLPSLESRWREAMAPQAQRRRNSARWPFTRSLFTEVQSMVSQACC